MGKQPPATRKEVQCGVPSGDPSLCCTILDNIGEGVLSMGLDKRIISFNPAAENVTGFKREEAVGQYCFDIFRTNICTSHCVMEKSIETGERQENVRALIINKTGNEIPISVSTSFLRDEKSDVIGLIEIFRDLSDVEKLKRHLRGCYTTEDIIGKDPKMQEIFAILPDIAESDSAVLIEGPSGSGKELFARAIHQLSPRRGGEFVAINCGAMPDTLLESELFGYTRGAFTGATRDKPGRFLLANHGTLFLDEIGNTSTAFQADLLRVLERREFVSLGNTKPIKSDFRVICATNSEIKAMVQEGTFREDLYYRLNVVKISLPALNEKRNDIPLLVEHFIEKYNLLKSRSVRRVTDDLMSCFLEYPFPGNVRELENLIEYAYILCKGDCIGPEHMPGDFSEWLNSRRSPSAPPLDPLAQAEADRIRAVLNQHKGNRLETARALGISRSSLWRKIKRYGL